MTENINPRHNMSRKSKKQEAELNAGLEPEPTPAELPPEPIGQLPETFEPDPPVPSALDGDLDEFQPMTAVLALSRKRLFHRLSRYLSM